MCFYTTHIWLEVFRFREFTINAKTYGGMVLSTSCSSYYMNVYYMCQYMYTPACNQLMTSQVKTTLKKRHRTSLIHCWAR